MNAHTEHFIVRSCELGPDHKIRVQALCNFMEETAVNHAAALGVGLEDMLAKGLTWVMAKMRIQFNAFPVAGDAVIVKTWPAGIERLQFRRDYHIYGPGDTLAVSAVTQWVVMGTNSRRVERMPSDFAALLPENPQKAMENADIRLPSAAGSKAGPSFPVRLADIDQNRHVNNVRYIDFVQEAADDFGQPGPTMRELDIIFRAEALRGDTITSATMPDSDDPLALLHSLFRNEQEIIRARTVWK